MTKEYSKYFLENYNFKLAENIGQHLLIDQEMLGSISGCITKGADVIEIGPGPGNLTEKIAERAHKVIAVEIDQRFKPFLDEIQEKYPNVNVLYKDAISLNLEKIIKPEFHQDTWQVASNLPFHISEPFLYKLIDLPIESAVLIVGDQLARKIQIENPNNPEFSRLSLLTQTFFEPSLIFHISKSSFYPQPRTDADLMMLIPREKREFERNTGKAILRNLFLTERRNPSVLSVIKASKRTEFDTSYMSKTESHRYDRRQTKQELRQITRGLQYGYSQSEDGNKYGNREAEKLGLSSELLSKPFSKFDNQDIRNLAMAIMGQYGQF